MQRDKTLVPESNVRKNTPSGQNRKIDQLTQENIEKYANTPDEIISKHLHELDKKWDVERSLELNMSAIALTGIVLSAFVNKKWLLLPAVVLGFFIEHAIQGWCPPLTIFRGLKVRHRSEIDQEKYAIKALRGDFTGVENSKEACSKVLSFLYWFS
jgi:hypothetical protein